MNIFAIQTCFIPILFIHGTFASAANTPPAEEDAISSTPAATRSTNPDAIARRPGIPTVEMQDDFGEWKRSGNLFKDSENGAKDWIDDAAGSLRMTETIGGVDFIYWKPGEENCLAAYSGIKISTHTARNEALRVAWEKIIMLLLLEFQRKQPVDAETFNIARNHLLQHLYFDGGSRRFNSDYFNLTSSNPDMVLQSAEKPYARLFRAAIKFDAAPAMMRDFSKNIEGEVTRIWTARQRNRRTFMLIVMTMLLIITVAFSFYCLLASRSRGFMKWPLRAVSAGVLIMLCIIIIYFSTTAGAAIFR